MIAIRKNQRGVVLVVSMMAMTCVVLFGLAYLQIATFELDAPEAALHRAQTRSLAEGGVEVAVRRLIDDPTFRGTIGPVQVGTGSYTVEITESAGVIEIQASGAVEQTSSGMFAAARAPTATVAMELNITSTFSIGAEIEVQKSSAGWDGPVHSVGGVVVSQGGDYTGDLEANPDFTPIGIDTAALPVGATQSYAANPDPLIPCTLGPGSMSGEIYVEGDLVIEAPFTFTGTLRVDGGVKIQGTKKGSDDHVILSSGSDATVIVSTGNIKFVDLDSLQVSGSLFTLGPVEFNGTPFLGTGSIVTNDKLHFKEADGTWSFDPAITTDPPSFVGHEGNSSTFGGDQLSLSSIGDLDATVSWEDGPVLLYVRPTGSTSSTSTESDGTMTD